MDQFDEDTNAALRRLGINPDLVSSEDMAKLRTIAAEVAIQIRCGEVQDGSIDPELRRLINLLSAAAKSIN